MLVETGVATWMESGSDEWIIFGKEEATEKVVARLRGKGVDPLMNDVKVVVNVLSCLISDQLLTAQGVLMANDDQRLVGIGRDADGDWYEVVAGTRDSAAQAGDAMSLWVLDPIKLFTARRPAGYNSFGLGDPVGDMLIAMQVKSQGRKAGASLMECVRQQREQLMEGPVEDLLPALEAGESSTEAFAGAARPRWTKKQECAARIAIKNMGGGARSLANTLERGAMRNTDENVTPAILRAIAAKNDDPLWAACKNRMDTRGGSGIQTVAVAECVSLDDMGPFPLTLNNAHTMHLLRDIGSKFLVPYQAVEKTTMLEALSYYVLEMQAWGHVVKYAICDATSVVGQDFKLAALKLGLIMRPTAPGQQQGNPVEASWRCTVKHDIALLLAAQENFTVKDWWLAAIRACVNSNVKTHGEDRLSPIEQITHVAPDWAMLTKFGFGDLATCDRQGRLLLGHSRHQLCLVITPLLTGAHAWMVRILGEKDICVRGELKLVSSTAPKLTAVDIQRLVPEVDEHGEVTVAGFKTVATEDLTMARVVERFQRQTGQRLEDPVVDLECQRLEVQRMEGRLLPGGGFSTQTPREASGRHLRSDGPVPVVASAVDGEAAAAAAEAAAAEAAAVEAAAAEVAQAEIAAQSAAQPFVPGADENLWWAANCRVAMSVVFGRGPQDGGMPEQSMDVDDAATAPASAGLAAHSAGSCSMDETVTGGHGSGQSVATMAARQSALRVLRDLFGEDPNEEQLQWAVFLREVLQRDPVHSDFGSHMPWRQADEQVARVFGRPREGERQGLPRQVRCAVVVWHHCQALGGHLADAEPGRGQRGTLAPGHGCAPLACGLLGAGRQRGSGAVLRGGSSGCECQ